MNRSITTATLASILAGGAALAAPPKVPLQGVLTDAEGAAVDGMLDVEFALHPSAESDEVVWSETQAVDFERGVFAVYLGDAVPLDASVFDDNRSVWLSIAVDGDAEMQRIEIATAPYAAFAQWAGDAETVGGVGVDELARVGHRHGWGEIDGVPADLADGDADTTYDVAPGGGLMLAEGLFGLVACGEGEVLKAGPAGWACAADSIGDADAATVSGLALVETTLAVTEGDRTLEVDLGSLVDDADADPLNELLQSAVLNGALLELTDAGGTTVVDLSGLVGVDLDPDPGNELLMDGSLDGSTLRLVDAGGELAIDLGALIEDADADPTNEVLTAAVLQGTVLELTDGAGTVSVDLAALVADGDADPVNEALTAAVLEGATLVLTEGGQTLRVDLSSLAGDDGDPANELLQGASLEGTMLSLSDAGGVTTVDLAGLVDDADADPANELLTGVSLAGTTLTVSDAGGDRTVELGVLVDDADADPANELLTGAGLAGTVLTLSDAGGDRAVELGSLVDDADADPANELISGLALLGTVLTVSDAGGERSVDLGALVADADADPTNELLRQASLAGTVLTLSDAGGDRSVDLFSLVADADADPANELLTGASLNGTVLTITDAGGARQVELGSLVADGDANPTNELQTLSFNGVTGALSLSGGNSVNVYQPAFTMAVNLGRSPDDIVLPIGINDVDDEVADVDLPFSVNYGGVAYNRVRISTNGWIEFGNAVGDSDLSNDCLPTAVHAGPFVAAYWDDLRSTIRWGTEGTAPNRVFAIYYDARLWNNAGNNVDFTIEVHEGSGVINVRYISVAPAMIGQGATIGFQAAGGAGAKAYPIGCNVSVLDDNSDDGDNGDQGWSVAPLR